LDSNYKLTVFKGITVPQGYASGAMDPFDAEQYLRKLGLSDDATLLLYTIKSVRVEPGFRVTSPAGHVYVGGQIIPGANHPDWQSFEQYVSEEGQQKGWRIEETQEAEMPDETQQVDGQAAQALMDSVQAEFDHAVENTDYERDAQVIQGYGEDAQQFLPPEQKEQFGTQIEQILTALNSRAREESVEKVTQTLSQVEISRISQTLDSNPDSSTVFVSYNDWKGDMDFKVNFTKKKEGPHTVDGRSLYAALVGLGIPEGNLARLKKVISGGVKTTQPIPFNSLFPFLSDVPENQRQVFTEGLTFAMGRTLENKEFNDSFDLSLATATYLKQYMKKSTGQAEEQAATMALKDFRELVKNHKSQMDAILTGEKDSSSTEEDITSNFGKVQEAVPTATRDRRGQYFVEGLFQLVKDKARIRAFLDRHFTFAVDEGGTEQKELGATPTAASMNLQPNQLGELFGNYILIPRQGGVARLQAIYRDLVGRDKGMLPKRNTGMLSDIRHFLGPREGNEKFAGMMNTLEMRLAPGVKKEDVYDHIAASITESLTLKNTASNRGHLSHNVSTSVHDAVNSALSEGLILSYNEHNLEEGARSIRNAIVENKVIEKHAYTLSSTANLAFTTYTVSTLSHHMLSAPSSPEDANYAIFSDFSSHFLQETIPNASIGTLESGRYRERVLSMMLPAMFRGVPYQVANGDIKWEDHQARALLDAAGYHGEDISKLQDKEVISDVLLTHTLNGGQMSYSQQLRNSLVRTLGHIPADSRGDTMMFTKDEVNEADISSSPYISSEPNNLDTIRGHADKILGSGPNNMIARLVDITNQTQKEAQPQIDALVQEFHSSFENSLTTSQMAEDVKQTLLDHYSNELKSKAESFCIPRKQGAQFGQRFEFLTQLGPLMSHLETSSPAEGTFRRISPKEGLPFDPEKGKDINGLYGMEGFTWQDKDGSIHLFGSPEGQTGDAVDYSHTKISSDYGTIEVTPYEAKMEEGLAYAHQAGLSTFFRQLGETMKYAQARRGGALPKVTMREMRNINHTQTGQIDTSTVNQRTNPVLANIFSGGFRTEGSRA